MDILGLPRISAYAALPCMVPTLRVATMDQVGFHGLWIPMSYGNLRGWTFPTSSPFGYRSILVVLWAGGGKFYRFFPWRCESGNLRFCVKAQYFLN